MNVKVSSLNKVNIINIVRHDKADILNCFNHLDLKKHNQKQENSLNELTAFFLKLYDETPTHTSMELRTPPDKLLIGMWSELDSLFLKKLNYIKLSFLL